MNSEHTEMVVKVQTLPLPPENPGVPALRSEMRSLTAALTLVLHLLGRPRELQFLRHSPPKGLWSHEDGENGPDTEDDVADNRDLNEDRTRSTLVMAVATLMVRADEVVAVGARTFPMDKTGFLVSRDTREKPQLVEMRELATIPNTRQSGKKREKKKKRQCDESLWEAFKPGNPPINLVKELYEIQSVITDNSLMQMFCRKKNPSLTSHLETFVAFLKAYSDSSTKNNRATLRKCMNHYMIASCWRKMSRRLRKPIIEGIIYQLHNISDQEIQDCHSLYISTTNPEQITLRLDRDVGRSDRGLLWFLKRQDQNLETVPLSVLLKAREVGRETTRLSNAGEPDVPVRSSLPHLFATLKGDGSIPARKLPGTSTYTKESCIEFHHLLVATLLAYGRNLCKLHKVMSDDPRISPEIRSDEIRMGCVASVYFCANLLATILDSRMMRHHLASISEHLDTPKVNDSRRLAKYHELTRFGDESDDSIAMEGGGDEDDPLEELGSYPPRSGEDLYKKLLALQVRHLHAVKCMTKLCDNGHLPPILNFTLLTVPDEEPLKDMMSWKETFENAFKTDRKLPQVDQKVNDAAFALKYAIEKKADSKYLASQFAVRGPNDTTSPIDLAMAFTGLGADDILKWLTEHFVFRGVLHCEAMLAAMMADPSERSIPDPLVRDLIKGLDQDIIGVSKLSCPVCSVVLHVLRGEENKYAVRGEGHDRLFTCELPPWLREDQALNVVMEFRRYLCQALSLLINQHKSGTIGKTTHKRTPSGMSNGSWSSPSESSMQEDMDTDAGDGYSPSMHEAFES
ncbi:hypothetical protein BD410DRAFT_809580 [Rickenella mellea]|uniref:Uncharacterized protein n=1 Tax=Rickenella mellea TaxID=50990 RepID=A0A4Y7PJN0_9AGAM|nr:hypothetical protein BD410DRAFT_809580 [Rickenella mellea]